MKIDKHFKVTALIFLFAFALGPLKTHAFEGKVVKVKDGDTLVVLKKTGSRITEETCRLANIDTPESGQAFGSRAKQALSSMVFAKNVTVFVKSQDIYKRNICEIYHNGIYINKKMVSIGLAWVFTRYNDDPSLINIESGARINKRGLWRDPNPIPPWEFRRVKKKR